MQLDSGVTGGGARLYHVIAPAAGCESVCASVVAMSLMDAVQTWRRAVGVSDAVEPTGVYVEARVWLSPMAISAAGEALMAACGERG